jgi:hypothetical protein
MVKAGEKIEMEYTQGGRTVRLVDKGQGRQVLVVYKTHKATVRLVDKGQSRQVLGAVGGLPIKGRGVILAAA